MKSIYYILLLYLIAMPSWALAQKIEIKGRITDTGKNALSGANIQLKGTQKGTFSDGQGNYSIKVPKESILVFSFINMLPEEKKVTESIVLNVSLSEAINSLDEVVINFKKPVIEADKGKVVFNVANNASNSGITAFDLLKRIPGVSIGQNDEILFRGSAGINVMIDGKMTYLSGGQLANYLKGMSAEDLNKIELITTPPAEFDAAGNSGIINIIPKRNLRQGYAVDIRSSVSKGKFWMNNQNIASSFRAEKWSVNGMFDFKTPHSYTQNKSGNTINDNGTVLQLERQNEISKKIKYYTWRLGADWQFLPKHTIGVNYHGYFDDYRSYNYSNINRLYENGNVHSLMRSSNDIVEPYHYDALNLNYRYDIDSLGRKITADAHYTSYRNFSDGLLTTGNYSADGSFINENILRSHQPGFVRIKSVQADIDLPYEKYAVKAGLKYAEVENDNRYSFDSLQSGNFVKVETMSNHFKYMERIAAAYLSGSKTFGKTGVEAGLRLEHTNADGHTVKQDISNKWEYTKLFPSLAVEQVINDDNELNLLISRRINRPSYTELNPVRWYTDQYFYYSGNPDLIPELAWVYNLTYSLKRKYIFSAAYNQSFNYIDRNLIIDDDGATVRSQSANFGSRKRFDFSLLAPVPLFPFWDAQLFSGVSYTSYPISQLLSDKRFSQWSGMFSLQQNISLPRGFNMNLSGFYYTSELRGIYLTQPVGWIDFGIKKSFLNNKLEAQFSVSDVLNTNRYWADSLTDVTDYYYRDKPYSRIFGLSFQYHFGGKLIKSSNKKTEEQERL